MRIFLLTGYSKRYFYLVENLQNKHTICGMAVQKAKPSDKPVINPYENDRLYQKHFKLRDDTENYYYKGINPDNILENIPQVFVDCDTLNQDRTVNYIRKCRPDVLISFGVTYLKKDILEICPDNSYNIHNGLVPWYKGSSAHFWAFYFLEPTYAGCTFHKLARRLDGGEVVHQCVGKLEIGDGLHDVSCKSLMLMSEDICRLMDILDVEGKLNSTPQKGHGRMYLNKDFRPEHLRLIYEMYDNKIVDEYLKGNINCGIPDLINGLKYEGGLL